MNMNKEYEDEIKALNRNKRKLKSDHYKAVDALEKIMAKAKRQIDRATKQSQRCLDRINLRIEILEGRLS
jgi:hypothetical protein